MNKNKLILLIIILAISFFLRIFLLGDVPAGVMADEANIAYDAYLLTEAGRDQWGKNWPLLFKGFGDYRLPIYQYILFPLIKIFGMNAFIIRLPSALFGVASVGLVYFFIKILFKDFKNKINLALVSAFILAINPWHFGMSRWIMEANVGLFFCLLALFFLLRDRGNDCLFAVLSIMISLYTYYGFQVFLPLFLIYVLIFYKKWPPRKVFIFSSVIIFLLIPLIFNTLKTGGGLVRAKQINLTNDIALIYQIGQYRSTCLSMAHAQNNLFFKTICPIFFNKPVFWLRQYLLNYFNHFSLSFLFFEQFEKYWQFLPPSSFFYFFDLPFFVMGFLNLFKFSRRQWLFLFIWLLVTPLADSISGGGHYARSFMFVIPIIIFIGWGYLAFIYWTQSAVKKFHIPILTILFIFNLFFISLFFIQYFTFLPERQSKYSHYEYKPLFESLKKIEDQYDNIYVSNKVRDSRQYIFYLYYNKISATDFFKSTIIKEEEPNGWVAVKQINKYHFISEINQITKYPDKSLLVVAPQELDRSGNLDTIAFLDGEEAFRIFETHELFYKKD
jgi:4-amino-4-deoxy-L-arabinose transferase-like glycosyltransferase